MARGSDKTDEGQQGQRAEHVGNHARIHDQLQRGDSRAGRVPGLMLFVDEFVDQDDDGAGEGHDATRPGPRIDSAEQEVHRKKAAPCREQHGQHEVDDGGQGQLPESCFAQIRNGVHRPGGLRLFCGWCERVLTVETHAGPSFEVCCYLAADETGIMDESIAHGTALPPTFEHGGVAIQDLIAHPAVFRLDTQQEGFPFACAFSNTHGFGV